MISELVAAIVAALEAAGLRVAIRAGDITPPVVLLRVGTVTDAGGPLTAGLVVTFFAYYIPIRGVDNLEADAAALDALYGALRPLAVADLVATATSVTVANDTWPAYRADLPAMATP